jgi:hypothetical protein
VDDVDRGDREVLAGRLGVNRTFTVVAALVSAVAAFLATRSQTFTTVVVDGHAMRLLVSGSGEPTVCSRTASALLNRFARTVAYDRAGVGLSEEGPSPRDGRRIAAELVTCFTRGRWP